MKKFKYTENATGKILSIIDATSWVIAEEYFETHFWYLPIIGYSTIEII